MFRCTCGDLKEEFDEILDLIDSDLENWQVESAISFSKANYLMTSGSGSIIVRAGYDVSELPMRNEKSISISSLSPNRKVSVRCPRHCCHLLSIARKKERADERVRIAKEKKELEVIKKDVAKRSSGGMI
jgi:hypothetical protein